MLESQRKNAGSRHEKVVNFFSFLLWETNDLPEMLKVLRPKFSSSSDFKTSKLMLSKLWDLGGQYSLQKL